MEFTLYYRGPLKSNGKAKDKHQLRKHFDSQLRILWSQQPLKDRPKLIDPNPSDGNISLVKPVGGVNFVPLVSEKIFLFAELTITYLRPEPAGKIFTGGGDIDNRLKTLMDSLCVPNAQQIPKDAFLDWGEEPFYCLLEDDSLVTRVNVQTDQLLEPDVSQNEVVLLVRVRTKATEVTIGNIGLT